MLFASGSQRFFSVSECRTAQFQTTVSVDEGLILAFSLGSTERAMGPPVGIWKTNKQKEEV